MIPQGLTNQQIAGRLSIEMGTVKNQVHNILRKLDASNRHEAATYWRRTMIAIGKESRFAPSEVVETAVRFFGPSGIGMDVVERGGCCARFKGGDGYVFVWAADARGQTSSEVTVEGREWNYQIKQFMEEI